MSTRWPLGDGWGWILLVSQCCPDTALDPLGHHAVTCRHEGDVVIHHNCLRDEVFDLCCRAYLSVSMERGHGLTRDLAHTRPTDILIAGWDRGKPAALDLTITSPLHSAILSESCCQASAAALAAEARKFNSNGPKCQELGPLTFSSIDKKTKWRTQLLDDRKYLCLGPATTPSSMYHLWNSKLEHSLSVTMAVTSLCNTQGRRTWGLVDHPAGHQFLTHGMPQSRVLTVTHYYYYSYKKMN